MQPIQHIPEAIKRKIRFVLTDIDDTLTCNGRIPSVAFAAMEKLQAAGIRVVPITGRPAGWCDHMARMWPVDGLVGENGAFYFRYDAARKRMIRRYWKTERQRRADQDRLDKLKRRILEQVPGCAISADQAYREADLAVDFCEDVPPLPAESIDAIVRLFQSAGATAKISSIHVNGWFGDYDKLAMTRLLFSEVFETDLEAVKDRVLFTGDSPNDEPMFRFFPYSAGVSNVRRFADRMADPPAYVADRTGGRGFAQIVDQLLAG